MQGDRLDKICKEKGLSHSELARRIGLTRSSLGKYLKDQQTPLLHHFEAIVKDLKVSADYLLGISDDPVPYYDKETMGLVKMVYERPEMKALLESCKKLERIEIEALNELLLSFKKGCDI